MKTRKPSWTAFAVLGVLGIGAASLTLRGPLTPAYAHDAPNAIKLNDTVSTFTLPSATGTNVTIGDWSKSKATVLMFIATRCPVSLAYDGRMAKIAATYQPKGVTFYGINSNKQEPASEVAEHAKAKGYTFTVLKDAGNKVADKFDAHVTPEVYVIDSTGKLVYHGQVDDQKNEAQVTSRPLVAALDAILAGKPVPQSETRAFGCSIKRVD
jgi:peroxiredoxin